MPDPSGSTSVLGLPYLLETDAPDVATASQLLAEAVEGAILASGVPVGGTIGWELATLPPIGTWLYEHGQTVTTAAYPALAAARPSWVSGSNIILPDSRNKFTIGAGGTYAGGATGGSATVTLGTGNIPEFSGVSVTLSGSTGTESAPHNHTQASDTAKDFPSSTLGLVTAGTGFSGVTFSGDVTGSENTSHSHDISSASGSVTFGSASPTPVSILNPYYAEHKIVRAA